MVSTDVYAEIGDTVLMPKSSRFIMEERFDAPVLRVTGNDIPLPYAS
ncbi:hypothetical protein [Wolbachia endosymbiont of Tettigetta isshikii]